MLRVDHVKFNELLSKAARKDSSFANLGGLITLYEKFLASYRKVCALRLTENSIRADNLEIWAKEFKTLVKGLYESSQYTKDELNKFLILVTISNESVLKEYSNGEYVFCCFALIENVNVRIGFRKLTLVSNYVVGNVTSSVGSSKFYYDVFDRMIPYYNQQPELDYFTSRISKDLPLLIRATLNLVLPKSFAVQGMLVNNEFFLPRLGDQQTASLTNVIVSLAFVVLFTIKEVDNVVMLKEKVINPINEVLSNSYSYLDYSSVLNLGKTCSNFNNHHNDDAVWYSLLNILKSLRENPSYKSFHFGILHEKSSKLLVRLSNKELSDIISNLNIDISPRNDEEINPKFKYYECLEFLEFPDVAIKALGIYNVLSKFTYTISHDTLLNLYEAEELLEIVSSYIKPVIAITDLIIHKPRNVKRLSRSRKQMLNMLKHIYSLVIMSQLSIHTNSAGNKLHAIYSEITSIVDFEVSPINIVSKLSTFRPYGENHLKPNINPKTRKIINIINLLIPRLKILAVIDTLAAARTTIADNSPLNIETVAMLIAKDSEDIFYAKSDLIRKEEVSSNLYSDTDIVKELIYNQFSR